MRDIELYRHLLGIESPWTVTRVELNVPEQRVDVWADHGEPAPWSCPECGTPAPLYDHADERVWRHLERCQFRTLLHARPPRVQCPTHGVRQVRLPWAKGRSRFTAVRAPGHRRVAGVRHHGRLRDSADQLG
jgi:transposase